ncbi:hypothetical protein BJY04DRAFT_229333 [Aspergillus karnatakaensis]|uniref:DUF3176 domain-containing protein n=1 Tax=Aspergillus karnatakaensis TaxID=1810916 RepID=UPI003CCC9A30
MTADETNPKAQSYEPAQVVEVGSDPLSATRTEYKRHPIYSPSEWLFESISSILALGLLIGIAIIFWYMDNKPLSAWSGRVSLNATISILTTACTTALMHGVSTFISQSKWLHFKRGPRKLSHLEIFDGASRGVWGSILLLTTIPGSIAAIGAFVTILRLGFSPFAQQVVLIEQREVITPSDRATFGYSHNYTRGIDNQLIVSYPETIPQDPGMQSAVHQGLFGIQSSEPFNCPGACRWPGSYISVGFRTECKNVTQATLETVSCGRENPDDPTDSVDVCTLKTPAGVDLVYHQVPTSGATTYTMNVATLLPNTTLQDTFPELTRFAIFRSSHDGNYTMFDTNVTECSLFLTAYEYTDATADGNDFKFATRREVDFGVRNPWSYIQLTPGLFLTGKIGTNETVHNGVRIPALWVDYHGLKALQNFLTSYTFVSEWWDGSIRTVDRGLVWPNSGAVTALMGDTNITAQFESMATSMTDYLRYGPNKQNAVGEIVQSVPYVAIRWGYFVVPVVTEAFAILFAVLSIVNNRRSRRVPLWKSSTLAVLACRHEERSGLLHTQGKDLVELEADAGKVQARLN